MNNRKLSHGMLQIRPAQMKTLEKAALGRFEDDMVAYSHEFSPRLCRVLGEPQLRVALRRTIARAMSHGFTCRGPVRLCVELMFLCGSDFDTDPQYPRIGENLRAPGDQMERAERIHEGLLDYMDKVSGPENVNTRRALNELLAWTKTPVEFSPGDFEPVMLREMRRMFPQRVAYIGDDPLRALIREGRAKARDHQFPIRGEALIVTLMFAFGHGCVADPLYPWIERTLQDDRIISPAARADRLERKAVNWLERVLRPQQGAAT